MFSQPNHEAENSILLDTILKKNTKDEKKDTTKVDPNQNQGHFAGVSGSGEVKINESYKNTDINIEEKKLKMKNEWDKFLEKSEDQFDAEIEPEN